MSRSPKEMIQEEDQGKKEEVKNEEKREGEDVEKHSSSSRSRS